MILHLFLVAAVICSGTSAAVDNQTLDCSELEKRTTEKSSVDNAQPRGDKFNDFDWQLGKELNAEMKGQDNLVISPISLKVVLAMLYEGARGNTAQQIEDVLDLNNSTLARRSNTRERFSAILKSLQTSKGQYEIQIGTHVFVDKETEPKELYLCKLHRFYNSDVEKVDFSDPAAAVRVINTWASNVTEGHIQHLLSEAEAHSNTIMMLLNAVYFKGLWETPFPENQTTIGPFHVDDKQTVDVQLMNVTGKFDYYNITELDAQLIRLPYLGEKFAMFVLLPNNNTGLDALINRLGPEQSLGNYIKNLIYIPVNLIMPKFEFDFTTSLRPTLEKLGLTDMFTSAADLSDIAESKGGRLVVSNVLQKAGISVNEIGSVAYAATVAELTDKFGGSDETIEIKADHPFLFFIEEEKTKTTVFVGKVQNPQKAAAPDDRIQDPTTDKSPATESPGISCDTNYEGCIGNEKKKEALQTRFNLFDANLLEELSKSETGNFAVSPVSIKTLLALVLEAADGQTLAELRNQLRLPNNMTEARRQLGALQYTLQKSSYSRVIVDSVAQVFVSKPLVTNSTYAKTIKDHYDAEVSHHDFTQPEVVTNNINSWINSRTRGLIPSLLSPGFIDPETLSILVSAVYFDGKWKTEFQRRNTRDKCFYSGPNMDCQLTPMMTKIEELLYKFDVTLDAHVLQLPYQDERFSMVIVVPAKKDGIDQLSIDSSRLLFPPLIRGMQPWEVNLTMPRFTLEFQAELTTILKEMGVQELFSTKANLPFMLNNKQGRVNAMIHKAKIEVNEKGTRAAAGSAAAVVPLMQSINTISLELDHPFYYFVCEEDTSAVLFMGRLSSVVGQEEEGEGGSDLTSLQHSPSRRPAAHTPPLPAHSHAQPANKPSSLGALNYPYTVQPQVQPSRTTRRPQRGF